MESSSDSINIEPSKIKLILNVSKSIFKNFEKTMRIILRYWEIAEFVSLSFEKYKRNLYSKSSMKASTFSEC